MPHRLTKPLLSTSTLRRRGLSRSALEKAGRDGELWQIHRGWYAEPGTDAELIRSMRLGGRLGCISALRLYGAWTPPDAGMHILMPRSASGRRLERADSAVDPVRVHWHSRGGDQAWSDGLSSIDAALANMLVCQPVDMSFAVLESMLHRKLVSASEVSRLRSVAPASTHWLFPLLDPRSEEGIESLTRLRLGRLGIDAEPQHVVEGVGRVDLLVDGWLVIELDGRATHAQQEAFGRDRRRTALLQQRGYTVLHFSYAQVIYDWQLIVNTVFAALSRR